MMKLQTCAPVISARGDSGTSGPVKPVQTGSVDHHGTSENLSNRVYWVFTLSDRLSG